MVSAFDVNPLGGREKCTKDKVLIFHHFRLGSFDLVGGVAELNVQFMYLQHFCTFVFQCVCIFPWKVLI